MATTTPPAFVQGGTYSALVDRMHLVTVPTLRDFSQAHRSRQGFYPSRVPNYTNPSGLNIAVGPCAGVIANTFVSDGGDYRIANPTSTQVTLAAASGTLNRIDVVGFQVKDNFYDSSGLNQVALTVIQGTGAAGAPAAPALPSSFIPVVECLVNANAVTPTSMTDRRTRTVMEGGIHVAISAAERNALGTPHGGFPIYRADKGWLEFHTGSAWLGQKTWPIARPNANAPYWTVATTSGTNTTHIIAQATIPDPGYSYYVQGHAAFRANSVTAGEASHSFAARVGANNYTFGPTDTDVVLYSFMGTIGGGFAWFRASGRAQAAFTGTQTVYLMVRSGVAAAFNIGPLNAQNEYRFDLEVIPV